MRLLQPLIGTLSITLYVITVTIAFLLIMPVALVKLLIPPLRQPCNQILDQIASGWIETNSFHQRHLTQTHINLSGDLPQLSRNDWYMLIANHQSWVDIMILVRVLNRRIPYVKFFFKQELLWVPLLGQALWALDFPIMRRHTKTQIRRNPALANEDLQRTQRACEIYRHSPVTIVNFLEGTRFTPAKHRAQGETYRHLLQPKAGGLAFTLAAMNGQLHQLVDVTIAYPEGRPSFWDYACGRVRNVDMHIRLRPITEDLIGDYPGDADFREHFQSWVNDLWREKDQRVDALIKARQR